MAKVDVNWGKNEDLPVVKVGDIFYSKDKIKFYIVAEVEGESTFTYHLINLMNGKDVCMYDYVQHKALGDLALFIENEGLTRLPESTSVVLTNA